MTSMRRKSAIVHLSARGLAAQIAFGLAVAAWLALVAFAPGILLAQAVDNSQDQAVLAGLRARRLFETAELYCQKRLDRTDLSPTRQAELVVELSRTYAEHALQVSPDESDPLWAKAREAIARFLSANPKHPQALVVKAQAGLLLLARGELLRQQSELVSQNGELIDAARTELRGGIKALHELEKEIEEARNTLSRRPGPDELTETQLHNLALNVKFQLAAAYRHQAETYPPDGAERADATTQAADLLVPLADREDDETLVWPSRVDLATCLRLQGRYDKALEAVEAFLSSEPPADAALALRAERIRIHLAAKQLPQAISLATGERPPVGRETADFDFACLETFAAAWKDASDRKDAEQAAGWMKRTSQGSAQFAHQHGPYWGRRAAALEAGLVGKTSAAADVGQLARAAENLYLSGELDAAAEQYASAGNQALAGGKPDQAFDLIYKAAAIEHKRQRHPEAAKHFLAAAAADPKSARAGESHLWGVYHTGQAARATTPVNLEPYAALLKQHVERWPQDPTSNQARVWWGRLLEAQKAWEPAGALYAAVAPDDARALDALASLERCATARLDELTLAGKPHSEFAQQAARWFLQAMSGSPDALPASWADREREAALSAAKFWLDSTADFYDDAATLLETALAESSDAPPDWLRAAKRHLVLAYAGLNRQEDAQKLLGELSEGKAEEVLALLEGIGVIAVDSPPNARQGLAALQLKTIGLMQGKSQELSPEQKRSLDLTFARATAVVSEPRRALQVYDALSKAYPQDAQIKEEFGTLLAEQSDPAGLKKSFALWKELEKSRKQGTDGWLRAQYYLILIRSKLGEREAALKLFNFVEILYPELGGPDWKRKFGDLRKRLDAAG
ncbi:MAG TPA: hypothetical protein VGE52_12380 [Pirellulales bacterium]